MLSQARRAEILSMLAAGRPAAESEAAAPQNVMEI
jgi:hypothetical protein